MLRTPLESRLEEAVALVRDLREELAATKAECTRLKRWNTERAGQFACTEQRLATRIAMLEHPAKKTAHRKRTWKEAASMAKVVVDYKVTNPKSTQQEIADALGLKRTLVTYYLGPRFKSTATSP